MKAKPRAAGGFASRDELLVLTAPDQPALSQRARDAAVQFHEAEGLQLRGLVAEIGEAQPSGPLTLAVVGDATTSFADKLRHAADRLSDPECLRINDRSGIFFVAEPLRKAGGKVALLFPGEGSQYPGMLTDLCIRFPEARQPFDRIDRAFEGRDRDILPSQMVFGHVDKDRIWDMDGAVEVVFSANAAVQAVLESLGLQADVMLGHSTGDYSALFASRAIAIADDAQLAELMLGLNDLYQRLAKADVLEETRLLAVGAGDAAEIDVALKEFPTLELAMDNCPHQRVFAGPAKVVAAARERLSTHGAILEELAFKRAYHTAAFSPALEMLGPFFGELPLQAPEVELWSCATASEVPTDIEKLRDLVRQQWAMPVRFRETIENLWQAGVRIFVDAGPRGNLSAFVKDILRGRPHLAVACDGTNKPTVTHLLFALGQLVAHAVPLDLSRLAAPAIQGPPSRDETTAGGTLPRRKGLILTLATGWPELGLPEATTAKFAAQRIEQPKPNSPTETALPQQAAQATTVTGTLNTPSASGEPAQGTAVSGGLGEIMTSHFEVTRRAVEAQERVLTRFLTGRGSGSALAEPVPMPLLGRDYERQGDTLRADVRLSLDRHRFLAHHTLGGCVSKADPELTALPVMPLTMTLELAAEASIALAPRWVCTGFENVVARRWITLDSTGGADLRVTARRNEAATEPAIVKVQIDAADGESCLSADVRVAPSYPPAPPAQSLTLGGRPLWDRSRVYQEAMFHGPNFRGIERVDQIDEGGAEAVLEVLPRRGLVPNGEPEFVTDPILLDQPGQVVGVWTADRLANGFVIFPTRVERIELFSPPLPAGRRLGCRAAVRLVGEMGVSSDLEVDDGGGRLHARITGWEDRRFDVPSSFLAFMLDPLTSSICHAYGPPSDPSDGSGIAGSRIAASDLPSGFAALGGIWQQVVAGLILSRDERRTWSAHEMSTEDSGQWLLARLAAKDAARRWLARHGLTVPPADIQIDGTVDRYLRASGGWRRTTGVDLKVKITFDGHEVMAVAGLADSTANGASGRFADPTDTSKEPTPATVAGGVKP